MSSIWETLSKVDDSEHTEQKNGPLRPICTTQIGLIVACRTHETGTAGPMSW